MSKARLRAVDRETPHDLDIARERIKKFRLDRDNEDKPLPISNQADTGSPSLRVDEVLEKAQSDHLGKK